MFSPWLKWDIWAPAKCWKHHHLPRLSHTREGGVSWVRVHWGCLSICGTHYQTSIMLSDHIRWICVSLWHIVTLKIRTFCWGGGHYEKVILYICVSGVGYEDSVYWVISLLLLHDKEYVYEHVMSTICCSFHFPTLSVSLKCHLPRHGYIYICQIQQKSYIQLTRSGCCRGH